ncbi:hypothetical protein SA496_15520 [Pseudomonas sp. JS3066]|uniref:hypothetical protein n=1 Tax=Pseudomonas sp. JS3066 TaxID=3090665 RepID=UPI002E7AEBB7|nr:hypothetical protein [Pseudomonas sp. JS3066]WVK91137.1 hypothetical protein SA496_15520 [Pseudomonas sp. JS3066]
MMLSREQILGATDRKQETVPVEAWGGEVILTALSLGDRTIIEADFVRLGKLEIGSPERVTGMRDLQVRMVAMSISDTSGAPLFTLDDVAELSKKSSEAIGLLADAATVLNGFAAKAVEDQAKN